MSMENIKRSIGSVEQVSEISLDVMLELLEILSKDVLAHNGVSQVEELPVTDDSQVLLEVFALFNMLLPFYRENREEIAKKPEIIKKRLEAAATEMQEAVEALSVIEAELAEVGEKEQALKAQLEALNDKKTALEKENAEILYLQEEIKELEEKIEKQKAMLEEMPVEELKQKHAELTAESTIMNNVASSILNDDYLKEALHNTDDNEELTVEENADLVMLKESFTDVSELDNWFKRLGGRVKSLLNVFEGMIDNIVTKGEATTAEKAKNDKDVEKK